MSQRSGKTRTHLAIAMSLVAGLCLTTTLAAQPAMAVTTDELQAKVDQATQAYNDATAKVNDLQSQMDDAQKKIDEVQSELPAQREKAGVAIRSMYKMQQETPGLVSLLLTSDSFQDFLTTYQYLSSIQQDNMDQTQQLADLQDQLLDAKQTLESSKLQAQQEQQNAQDSMNDAQKALDDLNAQIEAQKKAEEEARAKAEAEAKAKAESEAAAQSQQAASTQAQSQQAADSPSADTGTTTEQSNPNATDGSEVATDGEWMIGQASAYTPGNGTGNVTASGEILTEDSVTVAVPVSQRYLLGRTVQIRYGGKTVTARVTDTGGFAKYGRVLDLAGGVWKAFGFSSTSAWGVRAVQYRFL